MDFGLNQISSMLLDVLSLFLILIWTQIRSPILRWLQAHTTAKQRDTLHRYAEEAFAFAKTVYVEHDGPGKLAAAMAYLSSRLRAQGINVTTDEMRAAIEKAYLAYQAITTQPVAAEPVEKIVEKLVQAPVPAEVQQLIAAASAYAAASAPATNEGQA